MGTSGLIIYKNYVPSARIWGADHGNLMTEVLPGGQMLTLDPQNG